MVKQPISTKNIFANKAPAVATSSSQKKYFMGLLIFWLIIVSSLFFSSMFFDINQKYYTYFVFINFLVIVLIIIKMNSSLVKNINNIQKEMLNLSKNSDKPKPVSAPPNIKREVKYNTDNKNDLERILDNQVELISRISDLENKFYPHLPLNDKINIKTKENLNRTSNDPISVQDLIGALNFPKDETDTEGFEKLRIALADSQNGDLLRASQDVQTLLSQDGIYMDDLKPCDSKPEVWRNYSKGERGAIISSLSIIGEDEAILGIVQKLKDDEIFRDATYHFLRHFDSSLQGFCKKASDEEINRFSNTRTARAFKVLGTATDRFL